LEPSVNLEPIILVVKLGPIVWILLKFSVAVAMKALVFEGKPGSCFGTIRRAWYTFARPCGWYNGIWNDLDAYRRVCIHAQAWPKYV